LRDTLELWLYERDQFLECAWVSVAPLAEQLGDLLLWRQGHQHGMSACHYQSTSCEIPADLNGDGGSRPGSTFSRKVVGLGVEFPLCQLGHLTKPGEIARVAKCVAHKKDKKKKKHGSKKGRPALTLRLRGEGWAKTRKEIK